MINTTTLTKVNVTYLVKFLILLTVATGAPLIGIHSQFITGPIVNAALILSVFLIGVRGGLLIGMLPSTIALGTGLLPAVLVPMIPFIIISNSILILAVDYIRKNGLNYWFGILGGSLLKFLFLFVTSGIVVSLLINSAVAPKVVAIMSWPQLVTAVMGGILAFGILKILKK